MTPRYALGLTLYLALCVVCILPMGAFAANPEPYATWTLQHSGKHTLVWYFATKQAYQKNEPSWVAVDDIELVVYPGVRPPTANGIHLLEYFRVNDGEEVLDIGTGSGLHAVFAASKAKRVVATDIVPLAAANAGFNATRLGLEKKIEPRSGDLFGPIREGEKFDVFFFNINFPFASDGSARNTLHERFFTEVRQYMKPGARIYYQTSYIDNFPTIYDMLRRHGFRIMEMHTMHMPEYGHEPVFMMIQRREETRNVAGGVDLHRLGDH